MKSNEKKLLEELRQVIIWRKAHIMAIYEAKENIKFSKKTILNCKKIIRKMDNKQKKIKFLIYKINIKKGNINYENLQTINRKLFNNRKNGN